MKAFSVLGGMLVLGVVTAPLASAQALGDVARQEAERRKTITTPGKVFTNENLPTVGTPVGAPSAGGVASGGTAAATTSTATGDGSTPAAPGQPAAPAPPAPGQVPPSPSGVQQPAPGQPGAQPPATSFSGTQRQTAEQNQQMWRERITTQRDSLSRSETFADALQSRINSLTNDFASRADPAQRSVIGADRQKAMAELDRVKGDIANFQKAIELIQEEARKAGVPAGWVR
jgi:hypothetical protein